MGSLLRADGVICRNDASLSTALTRGKPKAGGEGLFFYGRLGAGEIARAQAL